MTKLHDHRKVWGAGYHAGLAEAQKSNNAEKYPTVKDVMLVWNPDSADVKLIPFPDTQGRGRNYQCDTFACWEFAHKMTWEQRKQWVYIEAIHLIVGDNVNPQAVHRALLGLAEYRDGLAQDMPGLCT